MKKKLGNFDILEQIDPGGHTTVYVAREHMGHGITRPAAIKILKTWDLDDEGQLEILRREADVLVALSGSPNIVTIYQFGIDEEVGAWIAMELAGRNLKHFITDEPAEPDQVRVLLRDSLRAMTVVHGAEPPILHRDVKPNNILSTSFGCWKIADFGIARRQNADDTINLMTVEYAAPELLDATLGEESPAMDVYSLGMVAYEYALGRTLFRRQFPSVYDPYGSNGGTEGDERPKWMYWHTSRQMTVAPIADLIDEYPEDLSNLVAAMTAKPLADRIKTANEALARLGDAGSGVIQPVEDDAEFADERPRRLWSQALMAVAAIVILMGLIAVVILQLDLRPSFVVAEEYTGNSPNIFVTGTIKRFPRPDGKATFELRNGRLFTVDVDDDGGFTAEIDVREIGKTLGTLRVEDRGELVGKKTLDLERFPPEKVEVIVETRPAVAGARVVITESARPDQEFPLSTNDSGVARIPVTYGTFVLEVTHPRFNRVAQTLDTKSEPETTITVPLVAISKEIIYREIRRNIERITVLARKKTECTITEEETTELGQALEELHQLGDGDPDIEDFIAAVRNLECGDEFDIEPPDVAPPTMPEGADRDEQKRRLIAEITVLARKKAECTLTDVEGVKLDFALKDLERLAAGEAYIESFIATVRATECGDEPPMPPMDPSPEDPGRLIKEVTRLAELKARCKLTAMGEVQLEMALKKLERLAEGYPDVEDFIARVRETECGDPPPAPPATIPPGMVRSAAMLAATGGTLAAPGGTPTGPGGTAATSTWLEAAAAAAAAAEVDDPIARYLIALPLAEFRAFIAANVPPGALTVEAVPHLNKVRVSGPVFDDEEYRLLQDRLALAMSRLELEVRPDAWAVCHRLKERLAENGIEVINTHAYLARGGHVLYVRLTKKNDDDQATAAKVARTFVIDQDIVKVLAYEAE